MLVVYDNNGTIYFAGTGRPEPSGIPYLYVEVPEGKYFVGIDTSITPHRAIFEDIKKSEMELLKEEVAAQTVKLAEQQEQITTQQGKLEELQAQNAALIRGIQNV